MGGAIVSKFLGCPRDGFTHKNLGRGSWVEARKLAFFVSHGTTGHAPWKAGWALRWVLDRLGAHTDTIGQCTDAIETGAGADGPAHILHMGTGSGGLGRAKSGTGMPT